MENLRRGVIHSTWCRIVEFLNSGFRNHIVSVLPTRDPKSRTCEGTSSINITSLRKAGTVKSESTRYLKITEQAQITELCQLILLLLLLLFIIKFNIIAKEMQIFPPIFSTYLSARFVLPATSCTCLSAITIITARLLNAHFVLKHPTQNIRLRK